MNLAAANTVMLEDLVIPASERGKLAHYSHQEDSDVAAAKYQSLTERHSLNKTVSIDYLATCVLSWWMCWKSPITQQADKEHSSAFLYGHLKSLKLYSSIKEHGMIV